MTTLEDVRETAAAWQPADFDETVSASDVLADRPAEISLVPEWMPVDPARSIEAAVIAVFVVAGWLLAIWAYTQLSGR